MSFPHSDICPVDPQNPFQNPTEEPDYAPPYTDILPEITMPGARLPLIPSAAEKHSLRKYFNLTFLALLFAFFTMATVHAALSMLIPQLLRIVDMQRLGELPENYSRIVEQYMTDSGISMAITLLSFFIGNLAGFWAGCRLTGLTLSEFFKTRSLTAPRTAIYVMIGLWIQTITSGLGDLITKFLAGSGIRLTSPSLSVEGSYTRLAMTLLYVCLIAPVTEELLLRGMVLKNAARVGQRFAIFLSAFLFALLHENLMQFLLAFPLGIFLGYITVQHNSLMPAITVHITLNTCSMLMLIGQTYLPHATFRTAYMIFSLVIAALGTVALLYLAITERLPDRTPHQGFRGMRIVLTAPLFWALICAHLLSILYQTF